MQKITTLSAFLLLSFTYSAAAFCHNPAITAPFVSVGSAFFAPDTIPDPLLPSDTTLCEANSLRLTINPGPGFTVEWSDGSADTVFTAYNSGAYWATVSGSGIQVSDTINIRFAAKEWQGLPADTVLCDQDASYLLDATLEGAELYLWQDGAQSATYEVARPGKYLVKVVVDECTLQDSLQVDWCEPCIAIPNAFTPNGDGANDTFGPIIQCPAREYGLRIYNRWGRMVFETSNPSESWDGSMDGEPQPADTYFYTLTFQASFSEPILQRKGDVALLR